MAVDDHGEKGRLIKIGSGAVGMLPEEDLLRRDTAEMDADVVAPI
ncbi:hypothetical protein [Sinorhizobium meliloti]